MKKDTDVSIPVGGVARRSLAANQKSEISGDVELEGSLVVPEQAPGIVVFAHGSGSSRHSPRNNAVASDLRETGVGTLLFDLLTEEEDRDRSNRFDIPLLTDRLSGVTDWLDTREETQELSLGYFGSSTGAAAALRAASDNPAIGAVVSRGGRVDLASDYLDVVDAPVLLIVGSEDDGVLERNQEAHAELEHCELEIVEGAGHLFEGPGELEAVADAAADWFGSHLQ